MIVCTDADVSRSRNNYVDDDYVVLSLILIFKGVDLVFILFMTEWEPITQFEDAVVSVGRVKVYTLDVKSPTYRVLSRLFAFVHNTFEDVHTDVPPILIGITWLKLKGIVTVFVYVFYHLQRKQAYVVIAEEVSM